MPSKVNTNSGVFIAAAVGFFTIGALLTTFAPPLLDKSWARPVAGLKNYTELAKSGDAEAQKIADGRKIYIREGCWYCHTQQTRTIQADTVRYGWRGVNSPVSTSSSTTRRTCLGRDGSVPTFRGSAGSTTASGTPPTSVIRGPSSPAPPCPPSPGSPRTRRSWIPS
jgi:hypothetical protein